ncbi:serine hydrolase domain-containing protein [uncultured Gimesia sp.]|uniref:serine hydrolase domain-containing protein n=1 Tax=uncultured Gimesia sp. TaxID=1678688 RepID=UPI002639B1DE|nr:serine hydrolase domain-containing protein [uncultured Gimesia sp.]
MNSQPLPRTSPSKLGVSARGIIEFLDQIEALGLDLHSLMIVKSGQIVTEGWWQPYRANAPHLLYSLSKSFTSTAIGIAEHEGLLSINDTVVSFFPEKVEGDVHPFTAGLKIRHLLAMASGHVIDTWPAISVGDPDMVRNFLAIEPIKPPGTHFCYNQGCTYTLSAIISKVTGGTLLEYLRSRLFTPMGVETVEWLESPEGITQGFSGLYLETESIAKFGILQLHLGEWNGDQLVPAEYLKTAHEKHVENFDSSESSDWQQGYGFQFWVCRYDAYRGDGAFGQLCVMIPQCEAVVVCTAALADMQTELDTVWKYILPALSGSFEQDNAGDEELSLRLRNLTSSSSDLAIVDGPLSATFARSATVAPFTDHLLSLRVESSKNGTTLTLVTHDGEHNFDLVASKWSEGTLPSRHQPFLKASLLGGWVANDRFIVEVVWPTSPHRLLLRAEVGIESVFEAKWVTEPLGSAAKSKSVIESVRQNHA